MGAIKKAEKSPLDRQTFGGEPSVGLFGGGFDQQKLENSWELFMRSRGLEKLWMICNIGHRLAESYIQHTDFGAETRQRYVMFACASGSCT